MELRDSGMSVCLCHTAIVGLSCCLLGCGWSGEVVDQPDLEAIDGYSVLIDAIRHSGGSEAVVHSGRFEMTQTRTHPHTEFKVNQNDYQRQLKQLKGRQAEVDEATWLQIPGAIDSAPQTFEKYMRAGMHDVDQMRFVFEGVTPSRRTAVTFHDTDENNVVSDRRLRISATRKRGQLLEENYFVSHDVDTDPGQVSIEEGTPFLESPNEFGRLRGRTWKLLMLMLQKDHLGQSGRLDEETVLLGQKLNRRLLRESNGAHGVRIVGEEEIEGSTCLILETDDPGDTNLRSWIPKIRVWIDPERGFITPRIVELANDEPAVEYISSDYRYLESAGLWWPRIHEVTSHVEQWVNRFEIDLDRSCVNCPIDESEFELAVAPGCHVNDRRDGRSQHLVVQKPYRMKFGRDGQLNFDLADGVAVNDAAYGFPPLEMLSGQSGWLSLLLVNTAFGCLVLLVYRLRIRHA